ncbi:Inosine-5'-monophosphate dehydrogenase [Vibrio aerogenes CECT 7868]|uniref:Inosine-5'-monophosphate dehydrogenase n=1 Tax=Vibrio aerogenes CECT 7868 TaxID=1216006 RepID=A0A1M5YY67_9VIBR|nr:CBS domain-containing protein [Vibrio aerogenes]SHI16967.1 Inosine-5'-monophosphate dehydrogenase [Vibrio aerogenes CECT 7868]
MIKIEDMMTRHPHTLQPSHTIEDALSLMTAHDIRHVPIVNESYHLLGIISQRDILKAQDSCLDQDTVSNHRPYVYPLSEIMNKNIMTVSPVAGLKESAIFMQKHKVGCLPIIDHDKLVGIITDSDFVSIAINLLELQEEVEPDEIDPEDETESDEIGPGEINGKI